MCMCKEPNVNGQPGYSWDGKTTGIRPLAPPDLGDDDKLIHDAPGRCGGMDSHCHHFRLVKSRAGYYLLVRHGGGDERLKMPCGFRIPSLLAGIETMSDDARYWLFQSIYHAISEAASEAAGTESSKWRRAIAEKRIETRRRNGSVTVSIKPPVSNQ